MEAVIRDRNNNTAREEYKEVRRGVRRGLLAALEPLVAEGDVRGGRG